MVGNTVYQGLFGVSTNGTLDLFFNWNLVRLRLSDELLEDGKELIGKI